MALDSTTKSLTFQTVWVVLGRLAGFAFAFAIPVVLVRALDQEAFATYKQFVLVAGFLLAILPLGFDASLFFFIPRDPGRAGNYLIQTVAVSVLLASVVGALLWVFREQLANALNSPQLVRVTALLPAYLVLDIVGQRLDALVIIEKQAKLAAFILAGSDAFKAVAMIVPALLTGSVYWVAVGITVFGLARFLAVAAWVGWRYRGRFAHGVGLVQMRAQAHYALPFGGAGFMQNALNRYHAFYVAGSFPTATFAIYAVGSQQIAPIQLFFKSLFQVALVRMTEYFGAGRLDAMRALWRTLIAKQAVVLIPFVMIMSLLTPAFIEAVFTADYLDAVPVFRISLLLIVLKMFNDHAVLRAVGTTQFIFFVNTVALVATAVAIGPLVKAFGISGAALGMVAGIGVMKALGLLRLGQLLSMSLREMVPWLRLTKYVLASSIATGVAYLSMPVFDAPLARFLFSGGLFWIVYGIVGWRGDFFSADDKRAIVDMARTTAMRMGVLTR